MDREQQLIDKHSATVRTSKGGTNEQRDTNKGDEEVRLINLKTPLKEPYIEEKEYNESFDTGTSPDSS